MIVDEVHAVAGSKRGTHLVVSLERLEALRLAAGADRPLRLLRVLLDANVLGGCSAPRPPAAGRRGRSCRCALESQILEETRGALTNRLGLPLENVAKLVDALDRAFPDARIVGYEAIVDTLRMPDPDDRHVLAAAIRGECDILLTVNTKGFPESALPLDADVRTAGAACPDRGSCAARRARDGRRGGRAAGVHERPEVKGPGTASSCARARIHHPSSWVSASTRVSRST